MKRVYCVTELLYRIDEEGNEYCEDSTDLAKNKHLVDAHGVFLNELTLLRGNKNREYKASPQPAGLALYLRIEDCRENHWGIECLDVIREERIEYRHKKEDLYEREDYNR